MLSFPVVSLIVFKFTAGIATGRRQIPTIRMRDSAESNARGRYSARFYIVAMLFVIFDVETLSFPWAILFRGWVAAYGAFALVSMFVFLVILVVGYIWIWKKGALDWA